MQIPIIRRGGMLDGSSSSTGLNFTVVSGTTEPADPAENTIWVNTTNSITKFTICPHEPNDPIDGMLWLKTSQSGEVSVTAGSEENIAIMYIEDSYIYTNEAWQRVESLVYQDGKWKAYTLRVYWYGDQIVDLTGGWITTSNLNATIEYQDNQIYIYAKSSGSYSKTFSVKTSQPIDVTNYNTLTINQDWMPQKSGYADGTFGLFANQSDDYEHAVASVQATEAYIVDISGITGSYYIGFAGHTSAYDASSQTIQVYIKEVVLSK